MSEKTIAEKLTAISENLTSIYLSGMEAGRAAPLTVVLTNGNRLSIESISDISTPSGAVDKILCGSNVLWEKE
jgi:hypothetical protein